MQGVRLAVLGLVLLAAAPAAAAAGDDVFRIEWGQDVQSDTVRVDYLLAGPFGGIGKMGVKADPAGGVRVPLTSDDHQRAKSLRAIVYARGCELGTVIVDPIPPAAPAAPWRFECKKLGTVWLKGTVAGHPRPWELTVQLHYSGGWSHRFFGIADGPTLMIQVAEAAVDREGRFSIELPDFASDTVARSYGQMSAWWVSATDAGKSSGYRLKVDDARVAQGSPYGPGSLPVLRKYPEGILFAAEPMR